MSTTFENEDYEPQSLGAVDLTAYDDDFATVESPTHDEVPDGKYQVRIQGVRIDRSQKGDPMIKWDLVIIAGSQANRHIFKNSVITPAALPFVIRTPSHRLRSIVPTSVPNLVNARGCWLSSHVPRV